MTVRLGCPDSTGPTCSPGTGSVLAPVEPGAKLPQGLEQVDVVAAHKGLGQVHDGGHEALLRGGTD